MFRERHEGEVLKMGEVFPRISANGELAQIFYTLIAKNLNQRLQRVQGVKGSRVQSRLRRWFNRPYGLVQGFGRSSLAREFESSKAGERRVYLLLITCHLLPDSLLTLLLASVQRRQDLSREGAEIVQMFGADAVDDGIVDFLVSMHGDVSESDRALEGLRRRFINDT